MEPIPFYRVLSERGFVMKTRSYSLEMAIELLLTEGYDVVQIGKGYRVTGYREKLYDLRSGMMAEGIVI